MGQIRFGCIMAGSGLILRLATTGGYFHALGLFMILGGASATAGGTFRHYKARRKPPDAPLP
ncbi:MAG TPA: hypothetical protein VGG41_03935 [Solirubrobacteraceae bacterium]|jgi:hypothetical protein